MHENLQNLQRFLATKVSWYAVAIYTMAFLFVLYSMSLGGGIDQSLLDALEAAYNEVI